MADRETTEGDDRQTQELRRRAEQVARERMAEQELPSPDRLPEVVYELQVHQIELEMQNEALRKAQAERTSVLEVLRDITSMANRAKSVEEALEYCLRRVAEHNGWTFGHAYLPSADDPNLLLPAYAWYSADANRFQAFRELTLKTPLRRGHGLPGKVFETGRPEWSTAIRTELGARRVDLAEQLGLATAAAFPVTVENRVVGVLEFFTEKTIEPKAELLESMASVGTQLGRVIERKAFQDRLLTLAENECRRIGQELHDDVGQELTGLALKAETLAEMLEEHDGPARDLAQTIVEAIDRTRRKTRALSRGLVPAEVDAPGLEAALENLAEQINEGKGPSCRFRCHGDTRVVDARTATQLYRIAQEAVANVLRHSQAQHVEIVLSSSQTATVLEIRDDGRGMPSGESREDGMGLRIMRYRAGLIGGMLTVESSPTGGACTICRLPNQV